MKTIDLLSMISGILNASIMNLREENQKEAELILDTVLLLANRCEPPIKLDFVTVNQPVTDNCLKPTYDELKIFVDVGKISAIKAYRERTGAGLREAKDAIENAATSLRI